MSAFDQIALYEESKDPPRTPQKQDDALERKKMKEMAKIRTLEVELANVTRIQRKQKEVNRAKKALELGGLDEPRSDRGGLPPTSTKSAKATANSARKPQRPPSGGSRQSKQSGRRSTAQANDESDTFLTDMLFKGEGKGQQPRRQNKATFQSATKPQLPGKGNSRARQAKNASAMRDKNLEEESQADSDLEDEYKDTVFDFDQSKALVQMAEDYLDNKPMLALMAGIEEDYEDDTQSLGGATNQTGMTGKSTLSSKSKVSINRLNVGKYGKLLGQRQVDRLDPESRARLEAMVKEIDDNLEELVREKEDYYKLQTDGASSSPSKVSRLTSGPNVYVFEGETKSRMDVIDGKLRERNPGAQDNTPSAPPSLGGFTLNLPDTPSKGGMNATSSNFSVAGYSSASRRSNVTTITLQSNITGLGGKQKALPKEAILRDKAMKRMTQAQLKEIEGHLRNLRRTDDLSYSAQTGEETKAGTEDSPSQDPSGIADSKMKKMIDQETLLRLIDECREDEERLTFLQIAPDGPQAQETMATQ